MLAIVWLPFGLSACGGKSSDVDDEPAGDSDGDSGGSTGTGGSGGSGDASSDDSGSSGGSSSDGGTSSGDTSAGDTSSSGGSASDGGTSSGDTGGTDGDGTDGDATDSGGVGGSSTGGTGPVDTTSGSTTGIVNPKPPMDLVEGCAKACSAEVESGCSSAASAGDCAGSCLVITRVESCRRDVRRFVECIEEDDSTSCSADGDVVFDGCVSEQLAAYSCVLSNAPDEELEEPCEAYCEAQAAAECETSEDVPGCVLGCTSIPTILPACEEGWRLLLDCTSNQEFTCDADGEPTVQGCGGEYLAFWACAYPEVGP